MARRQNVYTAKDLELFARYQIQRAFYRPTKCNEGEQCWVRDGPPSITTSGHCRGCGGLQRSIRLPVARKMVG